MKINYIRRYDARSVLSYGKAMNLHTFSKFIFYFRCLGDINIKIIFAYIICLILISTKTLLYISICKATFRL